MQSDQILRKSTACK